MTETMRNTVIGDVLTYWFPVRWPEEENWFEIKSHNVFGDLENGGVTVTVIKNSEEPVNIEFTNSELYGESVLTPEVARSRIVSI